MRPSSPVRKLERGKRKKNSPKKRGLCDAGQILPPPRTGRRVKRNERRGKQRRQKGQEALGNCSRICVFNIFHPDESTSHSTKVPIVCGMIYWPPEGAKHYGLLEVWRGLSTQGMVERPFAAITLVQSLCKSVREGLTKQRSWLRHIKNQRPNHQRTMESMPSIN